MSRPQHAFGFLTLALFTSFWGCSKPQPDAAPVHPVNEPDRTQTVLTNEPKSEEPSKQRAPVSEPSVPPRPHYYNRVVAVGIGIEKYQHVKDESRNAANDATKVLSLLRDQYGYETVPLIGPKATKKAIRETLDKYRSELGEKDALILFFAGHGQVIDLPSHGTSGYLVPYEANLDLENTRNPDDWAERALDMRALTREFEDTNIQHVLFIVDACCSGFMTQRGDNGLRARADLQELMARRSRTVIAATTERSSAHSKPGTDHGYFSGNLLKGLDSPSAASVTEVFLTARLQTVKDSQRLMLPQRGEFGTENGEFVFIPRAISSKEVESALTLVRAAEAQRSARRTLPAHLYDLFDTASYRAGGNRADLEKVWQQRLDRFRENASLGDPYALTGLSMCLARGLGTDAVTEQTARDAYRAAKKAFAGGTPVGKFALAMCLLEGTGVEKNLLAAKRLLEQARADGFALAGLPLADLLLIDEVKPDRALKLEELLDGAEKQGVPGAVVRRAALMLKQSPSFTVAEADRWAARLKPAVDAGLTAAQFQTYRILVADPKRMTGPQRALALKCLTHVAESGDAEAQFRLAAEYYQKEWFVGALNVPQDFIEARAWALRASDQGHYEATKLLTMIYVFGDGVKADYATSLAYYKKGRAGREIENPWFQWYWKHSGDLLLAETRKKEAERRP